MLNKTLFILIVFILYSAVSAKSQEKTRVYTSKFIPESITYNGSPDPNECWESVDWGVKIKTKKTSIFVLMPYQDIEKLKTEIGDQEVKIKVDFFEEPESGSGAVGIVEEIILGDKVIYKSDI